MSRRLGHGALQAVVAAFYMATAARLDLVGIALLTVLVMAAMTALALLCLLGLDLAVPDHTTLSRRAETLRVP
jgi:hypothetical protein